MSNQNNPFHAMTLTGGIVSQLSGSTLVGIFAGKWVDKQLTTSPLFLIIGLLMGLTAGTYGTVYLVRKFIGEDN